jgi:SsrA-binding protein
VAKQGKSQPGEELITANRRAARNYELGERFEAGLVLRGSEVKSCRAGRAHLNDAYVTLRKGEAFLVNCHIGEYAQAGPYLNHEPTRERKLLLNANELHKLEKRIEDKGQTGVPLRLYFKKGWVKVEIAIGTGRTQVDKRGAVLERETAREVERALRSRNKR